MSAESLLPAMQLITQIPFAGTGDTTTYADDYTITTCTDSSGTDTVGSPVRHPTVTDSTDEHDHIVWI